MSRIKKDPGGGNNGQMRLFCTTTPHGMHVYKYVYMYVRMVRMRYLYDIIFYSRYVNNTEANGVYRAVNPCMYVCVCVHYIYIYWDDYII